MKNILSFLFALSLVTFVSQNLSAQEIKTKSGEITRTLELDPFTAVGLAVNGDIIISKGPQSVKVVGEAKAINNLELEVKKNTWNIGFVEKMKNYKKLTFYITMPEVTGLSIAGSGTITSEDSFDNLGKLKISIAGSGDISFKGSVNELEVSIAGSGDANVDKIEAEKVTVSIAGSGDAYVHARENLKVSIAGSGDVHYKGRPHVKSSVAGSGSISTMD